MISASQDLRQSVTAYCTAIGADSLLVQGAGGNVSWKEGNTLWVKASGTWLADAGRKDIFVPVDLSHLKNSIAADDFNVTPHMQGTSHLKPSIETLFHALMPHKVVVHLHAIEIMAHLVRRNCQAQLPTLMHFTPHWLSVGYYKPGADLARAVNQAFKQKPLAEIVFLQNHGVILGADNVEKLDVLLKKLISVFRTEPRATQQSDLNAAAAPDIAKYGYSPLAMPDIQHLASDASSYCRLEKDWILYPDHAVFLGPKAFSFHTIDDFAKWASQVAERPPLIFIKNAGIFVTGAFSEAQKAQISCYSDIILRQSDADKLNPLTNTQVAELLNWDAEKYRQALS